MKIIRLDKDRKIEYDIDALLKFEDAANAALFQVIGEWQKTEKPKIKELLLFLWVGLLKHENMNFDEVKLIFPLNKISDIMIQCMVALNESMGVSVGEVKAETNKKKTSHSENGLKRLRDTVMPTV